MIFGGWSCNSGRRFNAITSNSENEYYEEIDYFYSFNTGTLTWHKTKFSGDLPSSIYKFQFNLRSLWSFCNCYKTEYNLFRGVGIR